MSNTNRHGLAPEFADDEVFTAWLLAELEAAILAEGPETVAMLIAEPVQNRGGCITPPQGYWQGLRALADRYGFLLVADEVITGFGRVGEWFGGDRYGARPDLVTVAKGITAGYAPWARPWSAPRSPRSSTGPARSSTTATPSPVTR